jgi:hypothetical protein
VSKKKVWSCSSEDAFSADHAFSGPDFGWLAHKFIPGPTSTYLLDFTTPFTISFDLFAVTLEWPAQVLPASQLFSSEKSPRA